MEAYRLMKDAKAQHQGVSQELRAQVSKVMKTKCAVDTFVKMQQKHRVRSEFRRAERVGEQVEEVVGVHLARRSADKARAAKGLSRINGESVEQSDGERSFSIYPSVGAIEVSAPREHRKFVSETGREPSVHLAEALSLRSLHFDARASSPTLTVNVEQRGAPLVCELATSSSGQVGVVVGAPRREVYERIDRHRLSLITKLSELGIKVSSLEVRRDPSMGSSSGGSLRRGRRSQEERDENTIA
jgi:hypothetical protein